MYSQTKTGKKTGWGATGQIEDAGMMMIAIPLILAYFAGSLPTSIIVCRQLKGIDIRQHGSGNAGATNVYRVMGLKVALFVLAVDAAKGVFGVWIPGRITGNSEAWLPIAGGTVAILGHVFSVFAKFKGGKGVGTALGVFMALIPVPSAIAFGVWFIALAVSKYVSAASILAGLTLAVSSGFFYLYDMFGVNKPLALFAALIALLIVITHRSNIGRLLRGKENRITSGKKERA